MIKRSLTLIIAVCFAALAQTAQALDIKSTEFTLANGLHVILIEDHRAPVVTHTVWYRVGAGTSAFQGNAEIS
jgi:zinc protease